MSIRIADKNKIPNVLKSTSQLDKRKLNVGVFGGGDVSTIAAVHEFGSPKNNIPERSYLRSTFDEESNSLAKKVERFIPQIVDGTNPDYFIEDIGLELKGKVQKKIKAIKSPPLKKSTIDRKGSSEPLIDEGNLLGSIDYRVE